MHRAYQAEGNILFVARSLKASALHTQSIHELYTSAIVLVIYCTAAASWPSKVNDVCLCAKAIRLASAQGFLALLPVSGDTCHCPDEQRQALGRCQTCWAGLNSAHKLLQVTHPMCTAVPDHSLHGGAGRGHPDRPWAA